MGRYVLWISRAGFALLLAGIVALFVVPRLLGWQLQVVLSGSMGPALPAGSVSFVEPVDPQSLEAGDLLVFQLPRDPSQQVSHRIVEIRGEGEAREFHTKGDANNAPDEYWVPASNVQGAVRWAIPYVGYVVPHVRTPLGYAILILIPAVIIIVGEARRIRASLRGADGSWGRFPIEGEVPVLVLRRRQRPRERIS
ncbi:MAG TPA: signal peptidase I [Anaerolineales bacterium]|nr:signal peptidase I [Anaerolineales bacterium]